MLLIEMQGHVRALISLVHKACEKETAQTQRFRLRERAGAPVQALRIAAGRGSCVP
jgi:hypothetical protein